ncbi:MAG TPA: permease-like cell division protein FtsX, partial [Saprospiraceae bacterium]|nr:permease-like cell division protein FtsX [Saprospiraceae bacterium]
MEKFKNKKKLGGYPAIGVVTSITLALFVLGLFGNLIIYSNQFGNIIRDNLNIKVYLKSSVSETHKNQLEKTIIGQKFVAEGEKSIVFIPKEDAEKDLIKQIGDYKEILGENPLKDAFIVKINSDYQDTTNLKSIKEKLEKMTGVFEATYEKHLFDEVNKNFTNISIALLFLALLLIAINFLLVNSTMRIALFSQRFLIRSMQLVGAKKWFIQRPFLYRAAGYGLLSGLLAAVALWGFSTYAQQRIPDLFLLHNQSQFLTLLMIL